MSKLIVAEYYLCDGRQCVKCDDYKCKHTSNIAHAIHGDCLENAIFERKECDGHVSYWEVENARDLR